jgi:hypothetical protein
MQVLNLLDLLKMQLDLWDIFLEANKNGCLVIHNKILEVENIKIVK